MPFLSKHEYETMFAKNNMGLDALECQAVQLASNGIGLKEAVKRINAFTVAI